MSRHYGGYSPYIDICPSLQPGQYWRYFSSLEVSQVHQRDGNIHLQDGAVHRQDGNIHWQDGCDWHHFQTTFLPESSWEFPN